MAVGFTQSLVTQSTGASQYSLRMDEGATYTYIGEAAPGSLTSGSVWRVKRLTNADTTIKWANGAAEFDQVWDDRAILTYS